MGTCNGRAVDIIGDSEIILKIIISKKVHKKNKGDYIFILPEEYKSLYSDWKSYVERFIFLRCDKTDALYIKSCISNIDNAFANGNDNKDYIGDNIRIIVDILKDTKNQIKLSRKKVFIVHGHNELLIAQTEAFLRQLGLEPIILRNQANLSQTIIEKLEMNTDVGFAIVLYTSCDKGCVNEDNAILKPRARQNVVFEHGFLNAKLGRKRVCALVEDGVEVPGDLAGIVYIPIDKNGAWKTRVAKEMREAGLYFDMYNL